MVGNGGGKNLCRLLPFVGGNGPQFLDANFPALKRRFVYIRETTRGEGMLVGVEVTD